MVTTATGLENILIVIGESFWVFSEMAQLRRLIKTRNVKGLSAPSITLNAAGNVAWCTYFALNHLWFPFVTNIFVLALSVTVLGFTLSNRKQFAKGLVAIVIIGPITSYLLLKFPDESGWFGMVYNWIASTPFLLGIIRRKKVSGLSEKALFFAVGAMLCTLSYAILIRSVPLVSGCVQGLLYTAVIMKHYYRYRRHD